MICLVTSCSSYKIITILLTVFLMLFIISLWVFYFITRGLWLLIPITSLPPPTPFSPTITCLISVSVSLFLFICFVFQIPYVSEIIGYFVILCWQFHFFYDWVVFRGGNLSTLFAIYKNGLWGCRRIKWNHTSFSPFLGAFAHPLTLYMTILVHDHFFCE